MKVDCVKNQNVTDRLVALVGMPVHDKTLVGRNVPAIGYGSVTVLPDTESGT